MKFDGTSLISIEIGNSITSIWDEAFQNCYDLTNVTIGSNVTAIGNYAFDGCSGLTDVVIPDSVTEIGQSAFLKCSGLTSVHIGSGVTKLANGAFSGCSGLTSITCFVTTAPEIHYTTFRNLSTGGTLYAPAGSDYSSWMSTSNYYLGYYNWTVQYI